MLGVEGVTALFQKHSADLFALGLPASERASHLIERLMSNALGSGLVRDGICLLAAVAF